MSNQHQTNRAEPACHSADVEAGTGSPVAAGGSPAQNQTTAPTVERKEGLHCIYPDGCKGMPRYPRPCNPGCYFQGAVLSEFEWFYRLLEEQPHAE